MSQNSHQVFQSVRNEIARNGDHRTWSIIVTIFGDLAQNPGDQISGPLLSALTQLIGIKPQAMRVALHRLRKNGWLDSEISGRTRQYRLSDYGLEQSAGASPRIYSRTLEMPKKWHIVISNPDKHAKAVVLNKEFTKRGYRAIRPGIYIAKGPGADDMGNCFVFEGCVANFPPWLIAMITSGVNKNEYAPFRNSLTKIRTTLKNLPALSKTETAVIRTLIVHHWRRLVLRQPDLSAEFFPNEHEVAECRALVWDLLEDHKRPSISDLISECDNKQVRSP